MKFWPLKLALLAMTIAPMAQAQEVIISSITSSFTQPNNEFTYDQLKIELLALEERGNSQIDREKSSVIKMIDNKGKDLVAAHQEGSKKLKAQMDALEAKGSSKSIGNDYDQIGVSNSGDYFAGPRGVAFKVSSLGLPSKDASSVHVIARLVYLVPGTEVMKQNVDVTNLKKGTKIELTHAESMVSYIDINTQKKRVTIEFGGTAEITAVEILDENQKTIATSSESWGKVNAEGSTDDFGNLEKMANGKYTLVLTYRKLSEVVVDIDKTISLGGLK